MAENESKGFTVNDRRGETREESPKAEAQTPPKRPEKEHRHAHRIDFPTFVMSLSTSAFVHLGLVEDPVATASAWNPPVRRFAPNPEATPLYRERRRLFEDVYTALVPFYGKLRI